MSGHYVYTLADSRDGRVFYVGKGQRNRMAAHEAQARAGRPSAKCDAIRAIWSAGATVERCVVARYATAEEAFRREALLIDELGLDNLTNIAPGGFGGRRKRRPLRWTDRAVVEIAPSLRAAFRRAGGSHGRLYVGPIEVTDAVLALVGRIVRDLGDARAVELLGAVGGAA